MLLRLCGGVVTQKGSGSFDCYPESMLVVTLILLDLLLLLGLTLRLTRLVITDDLGQWWVQDPVRVWVIRHADPSGDFNEWGWRGKLQSGLSCPFCVGFWLGAAALATLYLAGGPGDAHEAWRYVAGAFALNWVVGHVGSRAGDAGYSDDDDYEDKDSR